MKKIEWPSQQDVSNFINSNESRLKFINLFTQAVEEWANTIPSDSFLTKEPWEKNIKNFFGSASFRSFYFLTSTKCNLYMEEQQEIVTLELVSNYQNLVYIIHNN